MEGLVLDMNFCWPMVFPMCFFPSFLPMSFPMSPCCFPFRGTYFDSPHDFFFVPKTLESASRKPGSNVCPDQYRAIESVEDCQEAAGAGMQGLPPPSTWEKNDPNNQGHRWGPGSAKNGWGYTCGNYG